MEKEGGIKILNEVIKRTSTNETVSSFAQLVILQFNKLKDDGKDKMDFLIDAMLKLALIEITPFDKIF